jgi:hypothetical protein
MFVRLVQIKHVKDGEEVILVEQRTKFPIPGHLHQGKVIWKGEDGSKTPYLKTGLGTFLELDPDSYISVKDRLPNSEGRC